MQIAKRIAVWVAEVLLEALLFGCWLGVLLSSETGLGYGVVGSVLAVPVVLFINWYYLTRAIAGVAWMSRSPWLYPAIATTLFVVHVHFVVGQSKRDLTPFAHATEVPFLAGGACIVFACAFAGNWLYRKWVRGGGGMVPA